MSRFWAIICQGMWWNKMSFPSFSAVKNAHTSKQTRISTSMENIQSLRRKKPCIFIGCLLLNIPFTAKWKSFFKHYGIAVLVLKISLISKINLSVVLHVCHRIVYLVSLTNGHCPPLNFLCVICMWNWKLDISTLLQKQFSSLQVHKPHQQHQV